MTVESGAIDSRAMFLSTINLPDLMIATQQAAWSLSLNEELRVVEQIVVIADGIGNLVGEALAALCRPVTSVPVVMVSASVDLPAYVSSSTLVFALILCDSDEETLSSAEAAFKIGANVVVIGSSDHARSFASATDTPLFVVPDAVQVTRSSFALLVVSLLIILSRLGLFFHVDREIDAAYTQLGLRRDALSSGVGEVENTIALHLDRRFPIIYGATGIGSVAAKFWKAQVNLNAKSPAFSGSQPAASLIEAVGFGQAGDVTRQLVTVVQLHTDFENQRVRSRSRVSAELIREAIANVIDVHAEGGGALAQFFDLLFTGEIVSLHLAARSGIDPGPTPILDDIKNAIAGDTSMPVER